MVCWDYSRARKGYRAPGNTVVGCPGCGGGKIEEAEGLQSRNKTIKGITSIRGTPGKGRQQWKIECGKEKLTVSIFNGIKYPEMAF